MGRSLTFVGVPSLVYRTVLCENAANAENLLVKDCTSRVVPADEKAASIHAEEWPG